MSMVIEKRTDIGAAIGIALGVLGVCVNGFCATLSLENVTAFPGLGLANMPVLLSLEPEDQAASVQWDLVFDSSVLNLYAIRVGPAATDAGKTVSYSTVYPGTVRVLVAGINTDLIQEGVLATLVFTVSSIAPSGDQEVSFENVIFAHPYGLDIASEAIPGALTVDAEALPVGWPTCLGLSVAFAFLLIPGILYLTRRGIGPC